MSETGKITKEKKDDQTHGKHDKQDEEHKKNKQDEEHDKNMEDDNNNEADTKNRTEN